MKVDSYNDGSMHELRIRVMDKDYEVLWDGESVIKGSDTKEPITYGKIGLKIKDCDINLYRIEVTEIKDENNGNLDNYLLDYYDTNIPDYIIKQYLK